MSRAIICIVKSRIQAEELVAQLKEAGIGTRAISVLLPGDTADMDVSALTRLDAPSGMTAGGTAGSVIGGVLGLLAGIGMLAIPGAGPHLTAGPIIAALSGAAMGAAVGGIAGALIWLGVPQPEARRYESRVRNGSVLLAVHTHSEQAVRTARAVMDAAHAERVSVIGHAARDDASASGRMVARMQAS